MKSFFACTICLGLLIALTICAANAQSEVNTITNPIIKSQDAPDPWIVYHKGYYYFTATLDPTGGVWLWRAQTLAGLDAGEKIKVYAAPQSGERSKQIWAPELHRLNGRWYVYFTASNGVDETHRIYVLESAGEDPFGKYTFKGKVSEPGNESWAIDATVLTYKDKMYLLWVAHVPGRTANGIRIAALLNPWTIEGKSVLLVEPTYEWEQKRFPLDEGPVPLMRNGKLFLVFSASDTGTPDYALGLLTFSGGDVMNPKAWTKSPVPVFTRYSGADGNVFGPGHNGFFKSPDGKEDWIVYHGKETDRYTYEGRLTRVQKISWNPDGTPNLGRPIPRGVPLNAPSGEGKTKEKRIK
jgi:GH43 family beta-xylosidase